MDLQDLNSPLPEIPSPLFLRGTAGGDQTGTLGTPNLLGSNPLPPSSDPMSFLQQVPSSTSPQQTLGTAELVPPNLHTLISQGQLFPNQPISNDFTMGGTMSPKKEFTSEEPLYNSGPAFVVDHNRRAYRTGFVKVLASGRGIISQNVKVAIDVNDDDTGDVIFVFEVIREYGAPVPREDAVTMWMRRPIATLRRKNWVRAHLHPLAVYRVWALIVNGPVAEIVAESPPFKTGGIRCVKCSTQASLRAGEEVLVSCERNEDTNEQYRNDESRPRNTNARRDKKTSRTCATQRRVDFVDHEGQLITLKWCYQCKEYVDLTHLDGAKNHPRKPKSDLKSPASQGDNKIVLSDASLFSPHDHISIGKGDSEAEIVQIRAINGATVSLVQPLVRAHPASVPVATAVRTYTTEHTEIGDTILSVVSRDGFKLFNHIVINAGGENEEEVQIARLEPMTTHRPLRFAHAAGETLSPTTVLPQSDYPFLAPTAPKSTLPPLPDAMCHEGAGGTGEMTIASSVGRRRQRNDSADDLYPSLPRGSNTQLATAVVPTPAPSENLEPLYWDGAESIKSGATGFTRTSSVAGFDDGSRRSKKPMSERSFKSRTTDVYPASERSKLVVRFQGVGIEQNAGAGSVVSNKSSHSSHEQEEREEMNKLDLSMRDSIHDDDVPLNLERWVDTLWTAHSVPELMTRQYLSGRMALSHPPRPNLFRYSGRQLPFDKLFDFLNAPVHDVLAVDKDQSRHILVLGPPYSGKTSLVAEVVNDPRLKSRDVCWISRGSLRWCFEKIEGGAFNREQSWNHRRQSILRELDRRAQRDGRPIMVFHGYDRKAQDPYTPNTADVIHIIHDEDFSKPSKDSGDRLDADGDVLLSHSMGNEKMESFAASDLPVVAVGPLAEDATLEMFARQLFALAWSDFELPPESGAAGSHFRRAMDKAHSGNPRIFEEVQLMLNRLRDHPALVVAAGTRLGKALQLIEPSHTRMVQAMQSQEFLQRLDEMKTDPTRVVESVVNPLIDALFTELSTLKETTGRDLHELDVLNFLAFTGNFDISLQDLQDLPANRHREQDLKDLLDRLIAVNFVKVNFADGRKPRVHFEKVYRGCYRLRLLSQPDQNLYPSKLAAAIDHVNDHLALDKIRENPSYPNEFVSTLSRPTEGLFQHGSQWVREKSDEFIRTGTPHPWLSVLAYKVATLMLNAGKFFTITHNGDYRQVLRVLREGQEVLELAPRSTEGKLLDIELRRLTGDVVQIIGLKNCTPDANRRYRSALYELKRLGKHRELLDYEKLQIASIHTSLAQSSFNAHLYDDALTHGKEGIQWYQQCMIALDEQPDSERLIHYSNLAALHRCVACIHHFQAFDSEAQKQFNLALQTHVKAESIPGFWQVADYADTLLCRGWFHWNVFELDMSLTCFQQASALVSGIQAKYSGVMNPASPYRLAAIKMNCLAVQIAALAKYSRLRPITEDTVSHIKAQHEDIRNQFTDVYRLLESDVDAPKERPGRPVRAVVLLNDSIFQMTMEQYDGFASPGRDNWMARYAEIRGLIQDSISLMKDELNDRGKLIAAMYHAMAIWFLNVFFRSCQYDNAVPASTAKLHIVAALHCIDTSLHRSHMALDWVRSTTPTNRELHAITSALERLGYIKDGCSVDQSMLSELSSELSTISAAATSVKDGEIRSTALATSMQLMALTKFVMVNLVLLLPQEAFSGVNDGDDTVYDDNYIRDTLESARQTIKKSIAMQQKLFSPSSESTQHTLFLARELQTKLDRFTPEQASLELVLSLQEYLNPRIVIYSGLY